jgi:hypothetical protein
VSWLIGKRHDGTASDAMSLVGQKLSSLCFQVAIRLGHNRSSADDVKDI